MLAAAERRRITVVVADDHDVVREGIGGLLASVPDIEVVGMAADGDEAVALTADHDPDVVLMDLQMPGLDGIEATRLAEAVDAIRDARVIACTGSPSTLGRLADTLFVAVLSKPASPDEVLATVRLHAAA